MAEKNQPAGPPPRPASPPSQAALARAIIRSNSADPAVKAARARLLHPGNLFPDATHQISRALQRKPEGKVTRPPKPKK